MNMSTDFIYLALLSFVCGAQNACFSTLTSGQIRTTHLTGLSTDFGTDLAMIWNGTLPQEERELLKQKNSMRASVFYSFTMGAVLSAMMDNYLRHWSLVIPMVTSSCVAGVFIFARGRNRQKMNQPSAIEEPSPAELIENA